MSDGELTDTASRVLSAFEDELRQRHVPDAGRPHSQANRDARKDCHAALVDALAAVLDDS